MSRPQPRRPPGTSAGGQYAPARTSEPPVGIDLAGSNPNTTPVYLLANQADSAATHHCVTAWNDWRAEHREAAIDLTGADLRGAYLAGANLAGAAIDLTGADLRGAYLAGANLAGAVMERADLKGAVLEGANLAAANLRRANFDDAHATTANFRDANMGGATMRRTVLGSADMRGALMVDADLYAANLHTANLRRATLTYTDFSRAELGHADLSGAKMFGANFNGARCNRMDLEGADMRGVLGMIHRDVCPATAVGDELVVAHRNPSTGAVAIWTPNQKFHSLDEGRAHADTLDFELANEWNGYLGMVEARLAA